jgi:hypothetical protein
MSQFTVNIRSRAGRVAALAASLALAPFLSFGQYVGATENIVVTDIFKLENLLPEMSSAELGSLKDIASWCQEMSRYLGDRLAEARKQIDFQRDLKKVEIKGLEVRQKAAGKAKDAEAKDALGSEIKAQKAELEVLDAVKDMAEQEEGLAKDFAAAAKSLRGLATDFSDLAGNRSAALRALDKARAEAEQAGLPAPEPVIDYAANDKAMKSIGDAGKDVKELGDRLMKLSKARQGLAGAWEKMEKAKADK